MAPFDDPQSVRCPKCETTNPLDIVYGMPSDEMQVAETEGAIILGGCVINNDSPVYRCRSCDHEFGEFGEIGDVF
ncbi:MAG: hypothetical protein RLZZ319_10 [Actinomycetota bacterium]